MLKILESGLIPTVGKPLNKGNRPLNIVFVDSRIEDATIYDVDNYHRNNGLTMFAYHFYVTKKGSVYIGRPEDSYSDFLDVDRVNIDRNKLTICIEGTFDNRPYTEPQKVSIRLLCRYLMNKYSNIKHIYSLRELVPETNNPGLFFEVNKIRSFILDTMIPILVETPSGIASYSYGSRELRYYYDDILHGNDIELYQHILSILGYIIEVKNGYYDRITEAKTKEFQKNVGMEVNGIVDWRVYEKINFILKDKLIFRDPEEFYRILQYEEPMMFGEDIKFIKKKLRDTNFNIENEDDKYDINTREEVKKFQTLKGILSDGKIGPLTFKAIKEYKTIEFTRELSLTDPMMEGEDVVEIQKHLSKLGLYKHEINGKYDLNTKIAVINFQTTRFIEITGIVNRTTFNLIVNRVS